MKSENKLLGHMLDDSKDRVTAAPEAIRLAAWLNEGAWHQMKLGDVEAAGRELRRLHAENSGLRSELHAARAAAMAEAAKDKADAERYRFLRNAKLDGDEESQPTIRAAENDRHHWALRDQDADSTIDAAILAAGGAR